MRISIDAPLTATELRTLLQEVRTIEQDDPSRTVVIGVDCPELTTEEVQRICEAVGLPTTVFHQLAMALPSEPEEFGRQIAEANQRGEAWPEQARELALNLPKTGVCLQCYLRGTVGFRGHPLMLFCPEGHSAFMTVYEWEKDELVRGQAYMIAPDSLAAVVIGVLEQVLGVRTSPVEGGQRAGCHAIGIAHAPRR